MTNAASGEGVTITLRPLRHAGANLRLVRKLPNCYESGMWDGKRSDFVLATNKKGVPFIARCYEGFINGHKFAEWYNWEEYVITNISHWQPLPESPKI